MFLSFTEFSEGGEKESHVVLYASLKSLMPSLLEMITGGRVFQESTINIILSMFGGT
jgi:hypothetical protein